MASRLHAISSVEDIYAVVDKTILPIDYGGEEKPVNELIRKFFDMLINAVKSKRVQTVCIVDHFSVYLWSLVAFQQ